jgi:hypothetical protein
VDVWERKLNAEKHEQIKDYNTAQSLSIVESSTVIKSTKNKKEKWAQCREKRIKTR